MQTEVRPNIKLVAQYPSKGSLYRRYVKRLMDFILSLCALIILSPVLLIVAVLVRVILGSPVIFKQKRAGLNEKIFTLYKFRAMTDQRDGKGELLPDGERLTNFGRWMRSTSIDELPELWNIVKGEMSIVGPRPLLVRYLPYYTEEERQRHNVRPGVTGLAQISGRSFLSWRERFWFDLYYTNNMSLMLDIRLVIKTIISVYKRKDVANRSDIFQKSDGKHYIIMNGKEYPYSQPLDVERAQEIH